jgi:DNA-binding NtrC family response regulator
MATTSAPDDHAESVSVLVVDTDPIEARFVAEALELAAPAISTRRETDPDAALAAIEDGAVDCVVTDADLGDVDGVEFLDRVARTDETVRADLHTDADDATLARQAWDRGAAYARKDPDLDHHDLLARHVTGEMEQHPEGE